MRLRYLLRFAIGGDLRFISHRDTIRLFERVLVRAGLPVRYSEGFNPRLRLWLPLPRSLGTSADDEVLMIEATEKLKTEEALARLQDRSPIGLQVRSLQLMESSARPRPMRAYYELPLGQEYRRPAETDAQTDVGVEGLDRVVERFTSSTSWPIARMSPGNRGPKEQTVDLRPWVDRLQLADGCLRFVLPVGSTGSARPREVLNALGLPADRWAHRLRRTRVDWDPPLTA